MHSKNQFFQNAFPVSILFVCCSQANANGLEGSISAASLFSDNTLKQAQMPMDERQDVYRLSLAADYSSWLIDADINYQLVSQKYAENSQADEEYADGASNLVFGKAEDPVALQLTHSRRMLLSTPDAVDLVGNQEARDIFAARPEVRIKISGTDKLLLNGEVQRVDFPDNDQQNSKRNGVSLAWLHSFSPISSLQLSANQQDVTFDNYVNADYSIRSSMLTYGVELRKLKYSLAFGYNENEPELGDSKSAPTYRASVVYTSGYNQIDFSASRLLTDTSYGNGNIPNTVDLPDSDGLSLELDRIDRRRAEFNWRTGVICSRCVLSTGVSAVEDTYLEKDEQSLSIYTRAAFSYALSTAANMSLNVARSNVDFDNQIGVQDYQLDYASLEYGYSFSNGLNMHIAGRREVRDSNGLNGAGDYTENIYSISLAYGF